MNLTYINVIFTGKVLRWKLYLHDEDFDLYHVPGQEKHQFVPDALSRLCVNHIPPIPRLTARSIVALRPVIEIPQNIYDRLSQIHNSHIGHAGLKVCKKRLLRIHIKRLKRRQEPMAKILDRMVSEFIRQCPACQIMNRLRLPIKTHPFTCASYNPFEVLHLDHIGPLTKGAHDN